MAVVLAIASRTISPTSWPFWFLLSRWMTGTQLHIDGGEVKST
jgi:hypothetical protein